MRTFKSTKEYIKFVKRALSTVENKAVLNITYKMHVPLTHSHFFFKSQLSSCV